MENLMTFKCFPGGLGSVIGELFHLVKVPRSSEIKAFVVIGVDGSLGILSILHFHNQQLHK